MWARIYPFQPVKKRSDFFFSSSRATSPELYQALRWHLSEDRRTYWGWTHLSDSLQMTRIHKSSRVVWCTHHKMWSLLKEFEEADSIKINKSWPKMLGKRVTVSYSNCDSKCFSQISSVIVLCGDYWLNPHILCKATVCSAKTNKQEAMAKKIGNKISCLSDCLRLNSDGHRSKKYCCLNLQLQKSIQDHKMYKRVKCWLLKTSEQLWMCLKTASNVYSVQEEHVIGCITVEPFPVI